MLTRELLQSAMDFLKTNAEPAPLFIYTGQKLKQSHGLEDFPWIIEV